MKRTVFRTLAVAAFLAFGVAAFAQLTFNGYYRGGGIYNAPDSDINDGAKTMNYFDRLRFNMNYAAADDMYGFKGRIQGDNSGTTSGIKTLFSSPSVKYGEGYVKYLDGQVKLIGGKLDVTDYMVAQNVGNYWFGNVFSDDRTIKAGSILGGQKGNTTGLMLQTFPIENLSAAAVITTDNNKMKTYDWSFAAYYNLPGIGKILFNSQLGYYNSTPALAETGSDKSYVSGGFSYTAYPGLVATAALRYDGNAINKDGEYKKSTGAVAIVEYTSGPLFIDLAGDFDLTNNLNYYEGELAYQIVPQVKVRGYFAAVNVIDPTSATINLTMPGTTTLNKSIIGADVVLPVGGKAETVVGIDYGNEYKLQIPVIVKVNF